MLLSPELAGAGGLLIAGAAVAAVVAHLQAQPSAGAHPGGGNGLAGDYRVTAAAATGWTVDGAFTVRVDSVRCAEGGATPGGAAAPPVTCTVRVDARTGSGPLGYLPPQLRAGDGTALTPVGGAAAAVAVPSGRTVSLTYRFSAAAGQADRPLSRLLLGNGAAGDALSVRRQ
ncbi:hypothetical protein [Streptacidiphilus cavernicola]|uniref:Uncharacterized protein n=1 Tax=Streptacidiphilus cavernicola TaxID=3342716 RepID=A0ABV6VRS2_9ACTN